MAKDQGKLIFGAMLVGTGVNAVEAVTAPAPSPLLAPPRIAVAGVLATAMLLMLSEWAPDVAGGLAVLYLVSSLIIPNMGGTRAPLIGRVAKAIGGTT